jgi:integrase/recombinase XerD
VYQIVYQMEQTMKEIKATAKVILDPRRQKENGTFPLKLRITYNRQRKYYNTNLELTNEQYDNKETSRNALVKETKIKINAHQSKADKIIEKLNPFSFDAFEKEYFPKAEVVNIEKHKFSINVYDHFKNHINNLVSRKSIGTAESYNSAQNSFMKIRPTLLFENINKGFLEEYERYMLSNDKTLATIGIYLRNLRTICNQGIELNLMDRANYPFKKKIYEIPASNNIKKALSKIEIKAIFDFPTIENSIMDKSKDFWIFSYLCNGMNFKDICLLKWKDINNGKFTFKRAKTANSAKSRPINIEVFLNETATAIINKWGTKQFPENYVFDILQPNIDTKREMDLIKGFTKTTNKYLKIIGTELKFTLPLTTYVARHSFATILIQGNAPLLHIQKSLGHSSLKTTENYLGSFSNEAVKEYNSHLTNW